MGSDGAPLIACHDCDLLQREIPLGRGCAASCRRCGAVLYRNATDSIDRTLAYILGALVVFTVANAFPIFAIESQGTLTGITLLEAVRSLWNQDMHAISATVLVTTILIPALELVSLSYLLVPLKFMHVPIGCNSLLRLMRGMQPWGMIEVFMLGILVSLVKLTGNFKVVPGVALWSFGILTLLLAAAGASFSTRDVWNRVDQVRGRVAAP